VTREMEGGASGKENGKRVGEDDEDEDTEEPVKKKGRVSGAGAAKNKAVNGVKAVSNGTSRAASVDTVDSGAPKKGKGRKK